MKNGHLQEEKNRHPFVHPDDANVNRYGGYETKQDRSNDYTSLKGVGPLKIYGVSVEAKNARHMKRSDFIRPAFIISPTSGIGDFGIDKRLENFYRYKNSPNF